jgi:hypothetical protein
MLMINNHFTLFQLAGNLLKTKKCAPYFRGNTEFPIYFQFQKPGKMFIALPLIIMWTIEQISFIFKLELIYGNHFMKVTEKQPNSNKIVHFSILGRNLYGRYP